MNYLLLGFGLSNQSCAEILIKNNQKFCVWDDNLDKINLAKKLDCKIFNYDEDKYSIDTIVLSPGIRKHKFLNSLKIKNICNEIDIYFKFNSNKMIKIGCTGSFGKSTTVSLIAHILSQNDFPAFACGNIGKSINESNNKIPIIELSSFQLENINTNFDIGIILNIKQHHLNDYDSFNEYENTKLKLAKLSDLVLIPSELKDKIHSKKHVLIDSIDEKAEKYYQYHLAHLPKSVFIAAYKTCQQFNIKANAILNACKTFQTLPHRQEIISKNPLIINDSKSTSLECSIYLLNKHQNIFWIVGGKESEINSNLLMPAQNIKQAFILGNNNINNLLNNLNIKNSKHKTLENIIQNIAEIHTNEPIIFSPGFQSFDLYKNFEERGDHFKQLITQYITKKN